MVAVSIFRLILISLAISAGLFLNMVFSAKPLLAQTPTTDLTGYAWSSNVGWLSFNCSNDNSCAVSNYKVTKNNSTGLLSGYVWSPNIGWVSFNQSDLAGCPSLPCEAKLSNTNLTGWARALSAVGRTDGFNGWISLNTKGSALQDTVSYGPTLGGNNRLVGYAWGSNVIGWVEFGLNTSGTPGGPTGGGPGGPGPGPGPGVCLGGCPTTSPPSGVDLWITYEGQDYGRDTTNPELSTLLVSSGANLTVKYIKIGSIQCRGTNSLSGIPPQIQPSGENSFNFTNLSAGTYVFGVECQPDGGFGLRLIPRALAQIPLTDNFTVTVSPVNPPTTPAGACNYPNTNPPTPIEVGQTKTFYKKNLVGPEQNCSSVSRGFRCVSSGNPPSSSISPDPSTNENKAYKYTLCRSSQFEEF